MVNDAQLSQRSPPESLPLDAGLLLEMHALMVKARLLEERLIQLYRQGHGYFWIGGPGEEAFNVPLGLLMKKGEGPDYDYLHAHYRQSATIVALGEDPIGVLRQMKCSALDPYSGGRNFTSHFAIKRWNVVPVSSPIEVQYAMAPGTALAQKRRGGDAVTIVTGGDAGTAEGDFASCLLWSSRPGQELPVLMVVTNNQWGISTAYASVCRQQTITARAEAFGIRAAQVDGNDPVASYLALKQAFEYVRRERRPFLMEAHVSRLHGHSSASGGNRVAHEPDCVKAFEARLQGWGLLSVEATHEVHRRFSHELAEAARRVRDEAPPSPETIWKHVFAEEE